MAEPNLHSFTPAELEVMQVLWKHGELKPSEILPHVERSLTDAALRSILKILLDKDHLVRQKQGKAYYYKPRRSPERALNNLTRSLAEIFCDGSPANLIAHMMKTEKLSKEERAELEKLARRPRQS